MGGGGKGSTQTTQTMQIPPEVMARYNAVNARAEKVAQTPYQAYSSDPNSFVAPLTQTQQAGIQNTNAMAGAAQPYYGAAAALTAAGAGGANPQGLNVGQYYNPYTQAVAEPTLQALQQQQGVERSNLMNPQTARSFGGDRSGLVAANLARQQALGTSQAIAPIYQQAYDKALATAGQQQGVGLAAQQANLQRLGQAGAQFGQLGSGAQAAGLAGATAQLGAGATEQQTGQAGLQALYNQFQQQQAYPFQIAQFLSNIATGTGALSGNTTSGTTQGGGGFFSDERLKENVEQVGKTNDGQNIYRYNYKGDPRSQIGLIAQEVAQDHPEAVGQRDGYLTVDYRDATNDAVRGHKAGGGAELGTSSYDIDAPSAMMGGSPVSPEVLAGLVAKPMVGLGGLPITTGASDPGAAGLLAPKATGVSPGSVEGAQAQLSTLMGANMGLSQSGQAYFDQQKQQLRDFLAEHGASSQGGLVSGPGHYASGGYAEGGYMNPALQYYGPQAGKSGLGGGGPYGAQLTPAQVQAMKAAELMRPQQQKSGIETANQIAGMALKGNEAWKARPDFLRSAEDIAARQKTEQAKDLAEQASIAQSQKTLAGLAPPPSATEFALMNDPTKFYAHGGIVHREHHAGGLGVGTPYGEVSEENPLGDALTAPAQKHEMMQPGKMGQPAPQPSGAQQLGQMAGKAKGLFDGGKKAYDFAAKKLSGDATGLAGQPVNVGSATATPLAEATTGAASTAAPVAEGLAAGAAPAAEIGAGLAGAAEAGAGLAGAAGAAEAGAGLAGAAGAAEGAGLLGSLAAGAGAAGEGIAAILPFLALLSDKRSKHDIESVGELNDGQPVYRFKYNGDDKTRMGLMAQDVEKEHPEAVKGLGGVKMVDYKRATDAAARQHHADGERVTAEGQPPADEGFLPKFASTFDEAKDAAVGLGKKVAENVPTSENFWVPAIAGIGSMLASPQKTLAGAIGEGLVGGTGAYTSLQKQQADLMKQRFDLVKSVFKGPTTDKEGNLLWEDTRDGTLIGQEEYNRRYRTFMGGSSAGASPYSPPAAAPPPKASTSAVDTAKGVVSAPAPKVEPAKPAKAPPAADEPAAAPVKKAAGDGEETITAMRRRAYENTELWASSDPSENPRILLPEAQRLNEEIADLERRADLPQNKISGQEKILLDKAAALRTDRTAKLAAAQIALDKATQLDVRRAEAGVATKAEVDKQAAMQPGALKQEAEKIHITKEYERQAGARNEAAEEAKAGQQMINQTTAVLDTVFDKDGKPRISGGPLGAKLGKVAEYFSQAGFSDAFIRDLTGMDPTAPGALAKLRASMTAEISNLENKGSPVKVAQWNAFLQNNPGIELLPATMKFIIENVIMPKAKSMVNAYDLVRKMNPGKEDIENTLFDYRQNNPWYKTISAIDAENKKAGPTPAAPKGGLSAAEKAEVQKELDRRAKAQQGAQ